MNIENTIYAYQKGENHIELVNQSPYMLRDLKMRLWLYKPFSSLEVIRTRGSLTFTDANRPIELGNLCPEEVIHLYYTLSPLQKKSPFPNDEKVLSFLRLYLHLTREDGLLIGKFIPLS